MKTGYKVLVVVLILSLPLLSACDLFGGKSSAEKEAEIYQQQVDAINEAREIYRQQQEQYYQDLQEALQDMYEQHYENQ